MAARAAAHQSVGQKSVICDRRTCLADLFSGHFSQKYGEMCFQPDHLFSKYFSRKIEKAQYRLALVPHAFGARSRLVPNKSGSSTCAPLENKCVSSTHGERSTVLAPNLPK